MIEGMSNHSIPPNTVLFIWESDVHGTEGDSYVIQMDAIPRIGEEVWLNVEGVCNIRAKVYDIIWSLDYTRETPFHEIRVYI